MEKHPVARRGARLTKRRTDTILSAVAVAVFTVVVFSPCLGHEFVTWDDGIHVYANSHYQPLSASSLLEFWLHQYERLYIPLSYMLYGALYWIAKRMPAHPTDVFTGTALDPSVFHAASLVLHLINTLLVFAILKLLVRETFPTFVGACLFALHPLQVESVAWVSEIRGLFSATFALSATLLYVAVSSAPKTRRLALIWGVGGLLIVLALLAKPSVIIMPILLFAVGWLVMKRPIRDVAMETLPLLAAALPFIAITRSAQPIGTQIGGEWFQRPIIAGDALAFYFAKLVAPVRLCIDYARKPAVVTGHWWGWATALAAVAVIAAVWLLRRRAPELGIGVALYSIVFLPELGLIPFNYETFSTVADRYAYLAMLGPAIAAALFMARRPTVVAAGAACAILLSLAGLTVRQEAMWRNTLTLNRDCIAVSPNSAACHTNYAGALFKLGKYDLARNEYLLALQCNPDFEYVYTGLGDVYMTLRQYDDAANCYEYAAYRSKTNPVQFERLARAHVAQKHYVDAIAAYKTCIQLSPRNLSYWREFGDASYDAGRYSDASVAYNLIVTAGADDPAVMRKLEEVDRKLGRYPGARWSLQPDIAPPHPASGPRDAARPQRQAQP